MTVLVTVVKSLWVQLSAVPIHTTTVIAQCVVRYIKCERKPYICTFHKILYRTMRIPFNHITISIFEWCTGGVYSYLFNKLLLMFCYPACYSVEFQ